MDDRIDSPYAWLRLGIIVALSTVGGVGIVMMATLFGIAVGRWLSGAIFDLTGCYEAAFVNGGAWNLPNALIAGWLLMRPSRGTPFPFAGEVGVG